MLTELCNRPDSEENFKFPVNTQPLMNLDQHQPATPHIMHSPSGYYNVHLCKYEYEDSI